METVRENPMLLNISQHSSLTLQEQIIGQVRALILTGELARDEALPSIRELARQLRVGINTVQRAYEQLLREELIYARPAKGFFVAPLEDTDKAAYARDRFAAALATLVTGALKDGLSEKDLKQVFTQLLTDRQDDA